MCAEQGRDVIGVLSNQHRVADVKARLVELNSTLVHEARSTAQRLGLTNLQIVTGDASTTSAYAGAVPANIVLVCGIFGNISARDIRRTVRELPHLMAPRGTVIWTRHNTGTLTIANSTYSGNSANRGGGIDNASGTLSIVSSTIAYNIGYGPGGGIYQAGNTATLDNTIVASNTQGTGLRAPINDLAGPAVFSSASAFNLVGLDQTDSLTAPMATCSMSRTRAWEASAITAGQLRRSHYWPAARPSTPAASRWPLTPPRDCPCPYDQRGPGFPRSVNGTVDIGAVERFVASATALSSVTKHFGLWPVSHV